MISPKNVVWTLAATGILGKNLKKCLQKKLIVSLLPVGFEPGTSCIRLLDANHYTSSQAYKIRVKLKIKLHLIHFWYKIPVAARVQTTFFGLTMVENIWPACKISIAKPFMWIGFQVPVTYRPQVLSWNSHLINTLRVWTIEIRNEKHQWAIF